MSSYRFRVIHSSWGIAIDVDAEFETATAAPSGACLVDDRFFFLLNERVRLPDEDLEAFIAGLKRIAPVVRDAIDDAAIAVVELRELEIRPRDFQTEGMEAAAIAWACDALNIRAPPVKIPFDAERNKYLFDYSPD